MANDNAVTQKFIESDAWQSLQQYTAARIAIGRVGISIPLAESLNFRMMHAYARDAVYEKLENEVLCDALELQRHNTLVLHSQAKDRHMYLQRPDLGRQLDEDSVAAISAISHSSETEIVFILVDGLSAIAVNRHAVPLLKLIREKLKEPARTIAPIVLVEQGRVAVGDPIGERLRCKLSVVLIGERPGLSSPDSLGAYITYNPKIGTTDEARNCVSNIRPEGLDYNAAADKIVWLIQESLRRKLSGVMLKDNMPSAIETGNDN